MFKANTVVVIGAGAGAEYRMPVGSHLVTQIAQDVCFKFDRWRSNEPIGGDPELFRLLVQHCNRQPDQINRFLIAGASLSSVLSSAVSIDDALYQLSETPEAVMLGKICIVRSILRAEASSTIRPLGPGSNKPDDNAGRDGWIEQIFSMAVSGLKQGDMEFAFQNVTFVNFNYDRCLEHYLYWALQRIGIDDERSASIVRELKIIRPYGGIGSILSDGVDFVSFGGKADLAKAINRIRTYTESNAIHDIGELEQAILRAHLVLFLGFGFHAQNMELLKVSSVGHRRVMATVKKIHHDNRPEILTEIASKLRCEDSAQVQLFDMTAPELLRELRLKIQMTVG